MMRLRELLNELTFMGSPCTKDCSGHQAGYDWERRKKIGSPQNTPSQSFNNGTRLAITNPTAQPKIRDVRGRFASNPTKRRRKLGETILHEDYNPNRIIKLYGAKLITRAQQDPIFKNQSTNDQDLVMNLIKQIESRDPTREKKYTEWLTKIYANGSTKFEDLNRNDLLRTFETGRIRQRIQQEHTNINQFDSWRDFESTILDNYDLTELTAKTEKKLTIDPGEAQELKNTGITNARLIVPRTRVAACYYGQGTTWCTAATKGINRFQEYATEGDLIILIPNHPGYSGEKYQLHAETKSFKNEQNEQVVLGDLCDQFPGLKTWLIDQDPTLKDSVLMLSSHQLQTLLERTRHELESLLNEHKVIRDIIPKILHSYTKRFYHNTNPENIERIELEMGDNLDWNTKQFIMNPILRTTNFDYASDLYPDIVKRVKGDFQDYLDGIL